MNSTIAQHQRPRLPWAFLFSGQSMNLFVLLFGSRQSRLESKIHDTVQTLSAIHGRVEACELLHAFYAKKANQIDPYQDWHGYATWRQREHDSEQDLKLLTQRYLQVEQVLKNLEKQQGERA